MRKPGFVLLLCLSLSVWRYAEAKTTLRDTPQVKNPLQHEIAVTLKLVQVSATDKKGNPVTDLTESDFEIRDNGQRKNITAFEKHTLSPGALRFTSRPSGVSIPVSSPSRMSRKFFFFFDFAFTNMAGIFESRKAALHFIDSQLQPGDEIGVVSYSVKKGFVLHEYLTTEHAKIRQVIEGFSANKILGRAADIESEYLRELDKTASALGQEHVSKMSEMEERTYEHQVANIIADIIEFAKAVRYIPGSKNLILFSAGIANFVMYGSEKYETSFRNRYGNTFLRDQYSKMCGELAGSNCAVYAVNVAGLATSHFRDRDLIGDWSMQLAAKETGGRYFDNVNSYETNNREIQNLTGNYYVLGFPIDEKWDGEYHSLQVTVKRSGCLVFGQKGYFNPKPFSEYSANEKVLHLIDLALSEHPQLQEAIDIPVTVVPYAFKDKTDFFVLAKLPPEKAKKRIWEKAEIVTIVFNNQNDIAVLTGKVVNLGGDGRKETFAVSSVSLPPGLYDCRVAIRDTASGKGARGFYRIIATEIQNSRPCLFPPLLLEPATACSILEAEPEVKKEARFLDIFRFEPSRLRPLVGKLPKDASKLVALVRCILADSTSPELSFSGTLLDVASHRANPVTFSVADRYQDGNTRGYLLDLNFGELAPGRYVLDISASLGNTRLKSAGPSYFVVDDAPINFSDLKKTPN